MKVNIKRLSEDAIIPQKGSKGAAAYDLYIPKDVEIKRGRQAIPLDISIEMPYGYEAKIEPRSGLSIFGMLGYFKDSGRNVVFRLDCDVMIGKIDSDFRGNISVMLHNRTDEEFYIDKGTKIAQLTFYKVEDADFVEIQELSDTERGGGGFGSTGK